MSEYSFALLPRSAGRSRRVAVLVFASALVVALAAAVGLSASSQAATGLTGYEVVAGAPVAVSDGGSNGTTVSCPAGKSALSAGVFSHNQMMFVYELAPLDTTKWFVGVTQTGSLGYTEHFTPYVVCADTSSVAGIHVVADPYPSTSAAANSQTFKDAFCGYNTEYVVGGGFSINGAGAYGSISYPIDNRTWQVGVDNTTGSSVPFTTYAVCVPQGDLASYSQLSGDYTSFAAYMDQPVLGGPSTARTNNGASASGYCPAGTLASGGGVFDHDQDADGFIVSSQPSDDHRYWLQTSTDLNPPSYGEWSAATVICVTGSSTIDTTTAVVLNPPSPGLNQSTVITATVTPNSGSGTPTGTVTFYDNGVPISGPVTLSGGSASITTTFGGGSHSITAVYSGDSTYNPSTSLPVTFTIACASTITGNYNSPLTVTTTGLVCISNATVNGAVTVIHGALDIENSTIRGAVTASNGTGVRICGSTTSSETVTGQTGSVVIGDPSNNCAANTINGSVTASSNHAGGSIIGNTVHGNVTTPNNVPAFTVSGNHG